MLRQELWSPPLATLQAQSPTPFRVLTQLAAEARRGCPALDLYSFGGEPCPANFERIRQTWRPPLINGYGPTETVVTPWCGRCRQPGLPVGLRAHRPSCRRPRAYILDAPATGALGVSGELYLGGTGLAREYHGRAAMSASVLCLTRSCAGAPYPGTCVVGCQGYHTSAIISKSRSVVIASAGRSGHIQQHPRSDVLSGLPSPTGTTGPYGWTRHIALEARVQALAGFATYARYLAAIAVTPTQLDRAALPPDWQVQDAILAPLGEVETLWRIWSIWASRIAQRIFLTGRHQCSCNWYSRQAGLYPQGFSTTDHRLASGRLRVIGRLPGHISFLYILH